MARPSHGRVEAASPADRGRWRGILSRRLLEPLARRLQRWSDGLLPSPVEQREPPKPVEETRASPFGGPRQGPPEHWLAYIRQRRPELLPGLLSRSAVDEDPAAGDPAAGDPAVGDPAAETAESVVAPPQAERAVPVVERKLDVAADPSSALSIDGPSVDRPSRRRGDPYGFAHSPPPSRTEPRSPSVADSTTPRPSSSRSASHASWPETSQMPRPQVPGTYPEASRPTAPQVPGTYPEASRLTAPQVPGTYSGRPRSTMPQVPGTSQGPPSDSRPQVPGTPLPGYPPQVPGTYAADVGTLRPQVPGTESEGLQQVPGTYAEAPGVFRPQVPGTYSAPYSAPPRRTVAGTIQGASPEPRASTVAHPFPRHLADEGLERLEMSWPEAQPERWPTLPSTDESMDAPRRVPVALRPPHRQRLEREQRGEPWNG